MQHRARCLHGLHTAAERCAPVVRRDAVAPHHGHIARAEAGLRRLGAGHTHERDMPDGAEKAAVPVLVGLQRPRSAVLHRLVRTRSLRELALIRRALAIDGNIQQAREIDVGRSQHDAYCAPVHLLDGGDFGQAVVVGRIRVRQHGGQAFDHIGGGKLRARPEFHIAADGEGKGRAVAGVSLAQHVFGGEIVRHLEQALIQRFAQHTVDRTAVHHRVERTAAVPRQPEIGIRHLHIVHRRGVAVAVRQERQLTAAQRQHGRQHQRRGAFFPAFHQIGSLSLTDRSGRPVRRARRAFCGATRTPPNGTWYRFRCR